MQGFNIFFVDCYPDSAYLCQVKKIKQLGLFVLIALLFSGSIGIHVFEHFCKKDGNSISLFAPEHGSCESPVEPSCCHQEVVETESSTSCEIQSDCCQEEEHVFLLSGDFLHHSVEKQLLSVYTIPTVFPGFVLENKLELADLYAFKGYQPPPILSSGMDYCIHFSIFRL